MRGLCDWVSIRQSSRHAIVPILDFRFLRLALKLDFSGYGYFLWRARHVAIQCIQIRVVRLLGSEIVLVDQIIDECFLFDLFADEPLRKVERGPVFFLMCQVDDCVNGGRIVDLVLQGSLQAVVDVSGIVRGSVNRLDFALAATIVDELESAHRA